MDGQGERRTILDVLDVFFGDTWGASSVNRMSEIELIDLAEQIDDYYEKAQVRQPEGSTVRQYCGGASFAHPPGPMMPGRLVQLPGTASGNPIPFSPSALLYADELAINCPLDSWICRRRGHFRVPEPYRARDGRTVTFAGPEEINKGGFWASSLDQNRQALAEGLGTLSDFEEPIRSGWIILLPHLRYVKRSEEAVWAQVRRDVMDLEFYQLMERDWQTPPANSDHLRGMLIGVSGGYIEKDHSRAISEAPSLYFNRTLAIAEQGYCRFLATADSDYAMLAYRIQKAVILDRRLREALLIHAMDNVLAPALTSDNLDDALSIRAQERSFADWRSGLEEIVSGSLIPASASLREAQEATVQQLRSLVAGIRREANASRSLGDRLSQSPMEAIDVGVAAVLWMLPLDILSKIIASLPALIKVAVRAARSPAGRRASILIRLDRANITNVNS